MWEIFREIQSVLHNIDMDVNNVMDPLIYHNKRIQLFKTYHIHACIYLNSYILEAYGTQGILSRG